MPKRDAPLITSVILLVFALLILPAASPAQDSLVLGLPSYRSATVLYERFGPLIEHLSRELRMTITIKSETVYDDNLNNLRNGTVDIAFLGPASYVLYTKKNGKVPVLAAFENKGGLTYKGYIVVRKDSTITDIRQLTGKKIAFGDVKSTMGHIVPRAILLKAGVHLKEGSYKFLDNQENVALAVLAGDFDAGAVREDIFDQYSVEGLRAIATSPGMPDHVFVARSGLPKEKVELIRKALLSLKDTPEGRKVLDAVQPNLTALVPIADSAYDPLSKVIDQLLKAGVAL